ncbi:MAG TPA: hypothetical protein PKE29_16530 [Phycisphaerales bacterium]|nr:hypothetical protein [Phycisphaerales bacterium]
MVDRNDLLVQLHALTRREEPIWKRFYRNAGWFAVARVLLFLGAVVVIGIACAPRSVAASIVLIGLTVLGIAAGWLMGILLVRWDTIAVAILNGSAGLIVLAFAVCAMLPRGPNALVWLAAVTLGACQLTAHFRFMSDIRILMLRPTKFAWYELNRAGYPHSDL